MLSLFKMTIDINLNDLCTHIFLLKFDRSLITKNAAKLENNY